jgi:hypothetical protein
MEGRLRKALAMAASLALVATGCGDDDSEPAEPEEAVSPREAIAEIGETRSGLDAALAAYRKGDVAEAEQLVGDAYLQHFELVEPPLEERDEELMEELEVLIRETVRNAISGGEPLKRVERLVEEADEGLDEAERALES